MTDQAIANTGSRLTVGIVIVLVSTIIWASAGLFVRLLPFDIWSIIVWRNCFAVIFVGSYVLWRLRGETFTVIRNLGAPGWFVTACSTFTIIAFPAAFQHASVANVVTIYASLPFVTAALEWILFRARPSIPTLAAGSLALVGIAIMVGPSTGGPQLGDILGFLSTVSMALLTIVIRRYTHINMLPVALLSIFISGFIAWPMAQHLGDFGTRDMVVAAGFALFPLTLGLMLYVIGSAMVPATLSTLIQTLEAPFGVLWAWLGVAEVPTLTTAIGGLLVLTGVFGRLLYESATRDKDADEATG